ncbi:MAG: beta-lactamase [Chlamydiales bacterium]|nr:beta-lactamase [Chlamydiales bacterium]
MKYFFSRFIFFILYVPTIVFANSPNVSTQQNQNVSFDQFIKQALKDWQVPGLALAIIKDNETRVLFEEGYGVKKLGSTAPVNKSTLFLIGPCTKTFTTTSLMMLADRGLINLDKPLSHYYPNFRLMDEWVSHQTSVRDTLLQRIGFESSQGKLLWKWGYPKSEILFRLRYLKPKFSFRTKFSDSQFNYLLQSEVLAQATGISWEKFIERYILNPLNMRHTRVGLGTFSRSENVALPHLAIDNQLKPVELPEVDSIAAAGLMSSSISDLVPWVRCLLNKGNFENVLLLSPEMVDEMFTPQITISKDDLIRTNFFPELGKDDLLCYGLGWFIHDYQGKKVIQQIGNLPGASSLIAMIPDEKIGIIVLANRDANHLLSAIKLTIFDYFLRPAQTRNWEKEFFLAHQSNTKIKQVQEQEIWDSRQVDTYPTLPLFAYTGTYQSNLYGKMEVFEKDNSLWIKIGPDDVLGKISHWHYDVFRVDWKNLSLRKPDFASFTISEKGIVLKVTLESAGIFSRIESTQTE